MSKVAVFVVVARLEDEDDPKAWSIYGIDTKGKYYDDILDFTVIEIEQETKDE